MKSGNRKNLIILCAAAIALLTAGCTPVMNQDTGSLALHVRISGYIPSESNTVVVQAMHQISGERQEQEYPLDQNNYVYSFFSGLKPGMWDVNVFVMDNGSGLQIGAGGSAGDILAGSVTTGTAEGTYIMGQIDFLFSWASAAVASSLTVDGTNSLMVYEKEGDAPLNEINSYAYTVAKGLFQSLTSVSLRYPDGYTSYFGSRAGSAASAAWISFNDTWIEAARQNYYGTGNYEFMIKDVNSAGLRFLDTLESSVNFGQTLSNSGEIYNIIPIYEQTGVLFGGGVTITWSVTSPRDATANFAVFVCRSGNPEDRVFSQVISRDGPYSITIPPASLNGLTQYLVIIIGTDRPLEQADLDAVNSYEFNGILQGFMDRENTKDIEYIHFLRSYFTTN